MLFFSAQNSPKSDPVFQRIRCLVASDIHLVPSARAYRVNINSLRRPDAAALNTPAYLRSDNDAGPPDTRLPATSNWTGSYSAESPQHHSAADPARGSYFYNRQYGSADHRNTPDRWNRSDIAPIWPH